MFWTIALILPAWALGLVGVYSMCRIPHPPVPNAFKNLQRRARSTNQARVRLPATEVTETSTLTFVSR